MSTVDAYWTDMVTVALLGTDRREPPGPPPGGLADLAADDPAPTASQRLLQQVSATAVVRRAGLVPGPPVALMAPPDADPRPLTPPSATATWRRVVGDWAVLEDEWVLTVVRSGRRLSPELVPPLLARHRGDPTRHARVRAAAGPLGEWMVSWSPRLACSSRQRVVPELVGELPELPITPDLVAMLAAPPRHVADVLANGLSGGAFTNGHRAVLVNLIARMNPASLPAVVAALDGVSTSASALGLAFALADLARLRHHLLTELEPE